METFIDENGNRQIIPERLPVFRFLKSIPPSTTTPSIINKKEKVQIMAKKAKEKANVAEKNHLSIKPIKPLTKNQEIVFDYYDEGKDLCLIGTSGTGKTLLALYLSLDDILTDPFYKKIMLIRSTVPSRDMGFLPGGIKEKISTYETPYIELCSDIFKNGAAYDILKLKGLLEFTTTSHLRGITISETIVIIDECQNMTFQEIDTILTRIGKNCKVIICGDFKQNDLPQHREKSGMKKMLDIIKNMDEFELVEFTTSDIVRSGFVKSYLISKEEVEKNEKI